MSEEWPGRPGVAMPSDEPPAAAVPSRRGPSDRQRRTAALTIGAAVLVAIGRRAGIDLREIVDASGLTLEEAMALAVAAVQGWMLRGEPVDRQDRVTPRPT